MQVFKQPLFNLYGSIEFNLLAWECKETGDYHVSSDSIILEVLKNGISVQENESGEIVCTNLHSFAMPVIRYRLGDIVIKGAKQCRCGSAFPTIREIYGRKIDYFKLPNGNYIHPFKIIKPSMCDAFPWIRQYQMVQERVDLITLKLVTFGVPPKQEINLLKARIEKILENTVSCRIVIVNEIKIAKNGKHYLHKSLVNSVD